MTAAAKKNPAVLASTEDPFARVIALDAADHRRFVVSCLAAVALYVAAGADAAVFFNGLRDFGASVQKSLKPKHPIEIDIQEPPPPPPEPPAPEPEPTAEAPKEPPPKAAPAQNTPPPPPAAAQAGKVLTAPDDEPVDLTGQGFVQGTGDVYAGGVTSSSGTSQSAVRDLRAAPSGKPPGVATGTGTTSGKMGLARPARPTSGSWDHCGFPAEADIEQINNATVSVAVTILPDGTAERVTVTQDPGYGFGALAKRCALREHFFPALNDEGTPVAKTQTITINFRR